MFYFKRIIGLILSLTVAGCSQIAGRLSADVRQASLENIFPTHAGFIHRLIQANGMHIYTVQRAQTPANTVTVFIEGDGFAWVNRSKPSDDPTPINPIAAKMAATHTSGSVLWIARPCQYVLAHGLGDQCHHKLWTTHRFLDKVVDTLQLVINQLASDKSIRLVGFSGGAAVAIILASRLDNVTALITVGGNLDSDFFTKYHGVTPLYGSINPATVAERILDLPQRHYFGTDDTVIPLKMAHVWQHGHMRASNCVFTESVRAMSPAGDWASLWQQAQNQTLECRSS